MLLLQLLFLVSSAALVRSLPARSITEEDSFFHALSETEQKALLSLAASLQVPGSASSHVNEIRLPAEIAQPLVNAPDHFFPNLVSWISKAWGLTSGETQDLLEKGRSCRGHSCLDFNDISNYCCPFGK